jgi:hypothetical protein
MVSVYVARDSKARLCGCHSKTSVRFATSTDVCGNLVGLGNPLTNVSPQPGHAFSEMIDLLVSVWALSVVGTVVGVIGGLTAMDQATDVINTFIKKSDNINLSTRKALTDLVTADGNTVDFDQFKAILKEKDAKRAGKMSEADMKTDFDAFDVDGRGQIDRAELDRYFKSFNLRADSGVNVAPRFGAMSGGASGGSDAGGVRTVGNMRVAPCARFLSPHHHFSVRGEAVCGSCAVAC